MQRRTFCQSVLGGSVAAGLFSVLPAPLRALAAGKKPDLVAVQGGTLVERLTQGLSPWGGLSAFVRPGQSVLLKPNMGWAVSPAGGANTDPVLVKALAEMCLAAGAKKVTCFDNTCDHWRDAYRESGIEAAVKDAGGLVAPSNSEGYYQKIAVPGAKTLRNVAVHELYLEADVILNVPPLKHHSGAGLTAAMKNLMGVVWDRRFYHASGLDQCIADFAAYAKKPALNIVDASRIMLNGGPRGRSSSDFKRTNTLILSPDIVAADVAAALTFGAKPEAFQYIALGAAQGAGHGSLDRLDVRRIRI